MTRGQRAAYHELIVRSLRSAGLSPHTVMDPVRLAASVPQAWWLLGRLRPVALFTTGGYLALPLVLAARAARHPDPRLGGQCPAGSCDARRRPLATRVAVSFPPTLAAFPGNGFVSGTPIRSFDGIDRDAARRSLGLGPEDRLLLVFGGSQAVTRLNTAVAEALPRLLADWNVLHLAGEAGMADAGAARQHLPVELRPRYTAEPFLTDRMADALVAADLVVGRAGSSTCAELTAAGVASILVPYPYAGAHQRYNARVPRRRGRRVVVADEDLDADRLVAEVVTLRDDGRAPHGRGREAPGPSGRRARAGPRAAGACRARPLPSETVD